MANKSSVKQLPDEILSELNKLIAEDRMSLDDLVAWINERGQDAPSRSAIWRHSKKIREVSEKLNQSREIAGALICQIGPDATESKTGRLLVEILQNLTFDVLINKVDGGEESTPMDLMRLAKTLKEMSAAQKADVDREAKLITMAIEKTKNAAAAEVDVVARQQGLSTETVAAIKSKILGVEVAR